MAEWHVEFYADEHGREPCREWAENLSAQKSAAFRAALRLVLIERGLDVVRTEYAKALGGGSMSFASGGQQLRSSTRSLAFPLDPLPVRQRRSCYACSSAPPGDESFC